MTLPRGFQDKVEEEASRYREELSLDDLGVIDLDRVAELNDVEVIDGELLVGREPSEELKYVQEGLFPAAYFDIDGRKVIVTNPTMGLAQRREGVAHELGHIVLGHDLAKRQTFGNLTIRAGTPEQDEQATTFGQILLLPKSTVIAEMASGVISPSRLSRRQKVSAQLASDRLKDAEFWWQKIIEDGNTAAINTFGELAYQRGDLREAEVRWRMAYSYGDTEAAHNLARLADERGDEAEAELWRQKAEAMIHFDNDSKAMAAQRDSTFLKSATPQVEADWRRDAADGDSDAMYQLGELAKKRRYKSESERWFVRAAEAGHADAMLELGQLAKNDGADDEAEEWWTRAAENGSTQAMWIMGELAKRRGDVDEAKKWFGSFAEAVPSRSANE